MYSEGSTWCSVSIIRHIHFYHPLNSSGCLEVWPGYLFPTVWFRIQHRTWRLVSSAIQSPTESSTIFGIMVSPGQIFISIPNNLWYYRLPTSIYIDIPSDEQWFPANLLLSPWSLFLRIAYSYHYITLHPQKRVADPSEWIFASKEIQTCIQSISQTRYLTRKTWIIQGQQYVPTGGYHAQSPQSVTFTFSMPSKINTLCHSRPSFLLVANSCLTNDLDFQHLSVSVP